MTGRIALLFAISMTYLAGALAPAWAAGEPITIYTDQYAGDEAVSRVARDLIEAHYDTPVELKPVSVGVSFVGTAEDERGIFMAAWLPKTHESYWARVKDDVVNIGTLYDGARLGWVVPSYVPEDELASFEDLNKPEIVAKLNGRIQGISAGAGEMQLSKKALDIYGLDDYQVTTASGAAMTAALKRAIDNHEWIVVTGWSPHWMWERFDLRYLDDPKKALGEEEHVDTIVNPALVDSEPEIIGLLKRMKFSLDQINNMLADANATSYDEASKRFIDEHPELVQSWLQAD